MPVSGNGPVMDKLMLLPMVNWRDIDVGVAAPLTFVKTTFPNLIVDADNVMFEELEHCPPLFLELPRFEKVTGPAVT